MGVLGFVFEVIGGLVVMVMFILELFFWVFFLKFLIIFIFGIFLNLLDFLCVCVFMFCEKVLKFDFIFCNVVKKFEEYFLYLVIVLL